MFNGHGSPSVICGYKNEIIIKAGENSVLLKNTIVYSLSCSSALKLGVKCVTEGTKAFVGYDDEFALGMDTNYQATPLRDKRARMFLEPSNRLFESLLKGNKVKVAVDKSKKLIKRNISLLKTDNSPEAAYYAPYLFSNYLSLVVHGDEEVSIN